MEANQKYPIGIDLGTTFSCVGVWKDNQVTILQDETGYYTTPSMVAFEQKPNGKRLLGHAAKNQSEKNPQNTLWGSKRLIGREFSHPLVQKDMQLYPFTLKQGDDNKPMFEVEFEGKTQLFQAEQISSMILEKMKTIAEATLGTEVKDAVITVPAYFDDAQRHATMQAAQIARLNPIKILNEPTAAAMAYGIQSNEVQSQKNILVFDLGGGTFDVTVLVIDDGVFEVKSTCGDSHLGGQDFDSRLMEFFFQEMKNEEGIDLKGQARALRRMKNECEKLKITLSNQAQALLNFQYSEDEFSRMITRAKFEDLCKDLFEQCINTVDQALTESGMAKETIDEVILVGGSTRIPKVKQLVQEFFDGKELNQHMDPDQAVAYGAAVQAGLLMVQIEGDNEDIVLLDVTPLSMGIETLGGVMSVLIKKNTPIPCNADKTYYTVSDCQTEAEVEIFEGERKLTAENKRLGGFTVVNITELPAGKAKVHVQFDIDANGILHVTATDETQENNHVKCEIEKDQYMLSDEQVREMTMQALEFQDIDEAKKAQIEADLKAKFGIQ